jgi:hypothetical protein
MGALIGRHGAIKPAGRVRFVNTAEIDSMGEQDKITIPGPKPTAPTSWNFGRLLASRSQSWCRERTLPC